jgi:cytochrome c-type biogenesis protein CcmH/NrfG
LILGFTWVQADRLLQEDLDKKSAEELLKVKSVIEKAIEADPDNSELWVHLGLVHRKLDRVEDARNALERASNLNPKNANAYFMLGLIYEKKKDTAKALAAWEACLKNAKEDRMREIAGKHIKHLKEQ